MTNVIAKQQGSSEHFTVKNNQPTLRQDIAFFFENRQAPDFIDLTPPDHGRHYWFSAVNHTLTFYCSEGGYVKEGWLEGSGVERFFRSAVEQRLPSRWGYIRPSNARWTVVTASPKRMAFVMPSRLTPMQPPVSSSSC